MGKTNFYWESELEKQIHDCLANGSPMDFFCAECMTVKYILEDNDNFSEEEVMEYFSLEVGDPLKKKVERIFGKESVITHSFNRVTSGTNVYKKLIERDFGKEVLASLEYNLMQESGLIAVVE